MEKEPMINGWVSGGVTSAVAVKLAIDMFGLDRVELLFIDTGNEDEDTYRFLGDLGDWYGKQIKYLSRGAGTIQEVWRKALSLNVASGAICSSELKRRVREQWQRENPGSVNVFGFDVDEPKRAKGMTLNYPEIEPRYPLLWMGWSKKRCFEYLGEAGIQVPRAYLWGFKNNNCLGTGCVQGGIGYWQKMRRDMPHLFEAMARMEHELTDKKGQPVTCITDQSKAGRTDKGKRGPVFLLPHVDYPFAVDLSMKKDEVVESLVDCNGYCGVNDLLEKVVS